MDWIGLCLNGSYADYLEELTREVCESFDVSDGIFYDICFMGDSNRVKAELSRTELELLDMLEKSGIEGGFEALHAADEAELLPDPQIYDIVMFVIKDLEEEGKIYCKCRAGEGEYEAVILDYGISLICKICCAKQLIP